MKKTSIYTLAAVAMFSLGLFTSCVDLDITPKNVLTANDIYNPNGIKAYMAGIYNHLPMEDFNYNAGAGGRLSGGYNSTGADGIRPLGLGTGEQVSRFGTGMMKHQGGYWGEGFKIIRQCNSLIADLPNHPELAEQAKSWIAEAKFIRAYIYFQLTKRYGGMPIITEPQHMDSNDPSKLFVKRSSHADTYDFILKDLDDAIADLPEDNEGAGPTRANKYIAAGLKSRVALFAGSIARYGSAKFPDWIVDGVELEGIPSDKANGYFQQAWDAAKLLEGHYQLRTAGATDTKSLVDNFAKIWEDAGSSNDKESIWIRKYDYTSYVHSFQAFYAPPRMSDGGCAFNPTLDWVELFDGIPEDENGHFKDTDEDGNYIIYKSSHEMWDKTEPRLQASILIPGIPIRKDEKGNPYYLDIRSAIIKEDIDPTTAKIKKFTVDDGLQESGLRSSTVWNKKDYPAGNPYVAKTILDWSNEQSDNQTQTYKLSDGTIMTKNGQDGPVIPSTPTTNTITGLLGRKFVDIQSSVSACKKQQSTNPWIEMRYAEILLNRAEAALELAQNGVASYGGKDMQQDAFDCINAVRSRGGAILLKSPSELSTEPAYTQHFKVEPGSQTTWLGPNGKGGFVEAPNRGLQIIRVERYKELAFESKIYWDLRRWFTFDTQIYNYHRRGLYPFMFAKGAKHVGTHGEADGYFFYDAKTAEQGGGRISFGSVNGYYDGIPTSELQNNPLLQKNQFQ